ncbi:MAG: hypothetical protein WC676_00845 [Candidatus Omnitrophota bacterium]
MNIKNMASTQNLRSASLFLGALVIISIHIHTLIKETTKNQQLRQNVPAQFLGYKFAGLEETLRDVRYIGYYSDKSLDDRVFAAQFAQAQYILTPAILDFNNTDHDFILFDCSTEDIAMRKIKQIGAVPLKKNQFGIILARKIK